MGSIYSILGNAVSVAERPGGGAVFSPGDLENVDGIAWTDVVGLRQGWGTTFRGKGGKFIWFHLPFPTPVIVNDRQSELVRLDLHFDITGAGSLESVHLWGNARNRWFTRDSLGATGDIGLDLAGALRGAMGISLGVNFREAANVTFRGATLTLA